jgi:N-acetylmuramoyl-L-alanine amidase
MTTFPMIGTLVLAISALAAPPGSAAADSSSAAMVTSVRSFPGPTSTRLVIGFSRPVAFVAPDSGEARKVRIAIPGESLVRAAEVPERLRTGDEVVDSVRFVTNPAGTQVEIWLRDSTAFSVMGLAASDEQPYRIVVEVQRVGGEAAQTQQLEKVASGKKHERVRVVAVDAGHGGEDTGARGPHRVLEKNITLAVARAVVDEINRTPGLKGVLVRDGDYFIPLRDRYLNAEKMKADVFVSIHCNSSRRRGRGSGTEVYFLSLRGAADQADRDLADAENAADLVGGVPPQAEDELVSILYDVKRSSALQQSQLLAESILDRVASENHLASRGVKQAGFVVLKSVEFPSVLVETAFINNPQEARLLASPTFQKRISREIASGVKNYFEKAGITLASPQPGGM